MKRQRRYLAKRRNRWTVLGDRPSGRVGAVDRSSRAPTH
uniref:Uncharacterized protein n=1 Tax=Nonomuraea gerenzanensis TaxID=93944 RepID=A0A1M4EN65_9ACTN|nr:hypothetical protein BN4615_P9808 [Nonomuraea gerenzanensis]